MITIPDCRIYLRALEPTDLDVLYAWENDASLWCVGSTVAPFSRHQLTDYVMNYSNDIYATNQLRLMACLKSDDSVVGTVDITDFVPADQRAQVGILIAPEHQRMGYGSETLQIVTDYARRHLLLHQLYAVIPGDNRASLALFKSAGFKTAGHLRSWLRLPGDRYADAVVVQLLFS
jgi:diamine N-acetyltransferase